MRFLVLILLFLAADLSAQAIDVSVQSFNSGTIGLYEKFEVVVALENVGYSNPYDPGEVDLRAVFTAPSGKVWEIFGFYDNFNHADHWKVRFAPNEVGKWNFYLTLKSGDGNDQSVVHSFDAVDSDYHGWIRVSPDNSHYFIHDDGTPFYGVGPYYPWNVSNSSTGLAQLEASGCNFWGYWNIMYDTGEIIESMNSGLGRYDQYKCGRIDQLINWSETRNLKMMLAIWPHDLLSNTVWAHQWHQNPYNTICSVEDFYESEAAWQYQERQYRYIIARWGYSRALAVWEIVNEVNGTDGWQAGRQNEARNWVGRVHDYLTTNDPNQRPTTASVSGGQYWPEGYAEVDIPNVHMYETGWLAKYPGNDLRSSAYTYFNISRQLWRDFDKPAIFGEAGYTNSYGNFAAGSEAYTAMFHNALWAAWAGGLAATPLWWDFGSKQLMTPDVMEQLRTFSVIARDYNYAGHSFTPYHIIAEKCDVYAMGSSEAIFGWVREAYGRPVNGKILQFRALEDTSYQIHWYNTWTAGMICSDFIIGVDTLVTIPVPATAQDIPDAAFFLEKAAEGDTPAKLRLSSATRQIVVRRGEKAHILCTVHDADGRFVRSAENRIQFRIEGSGAFTRPSIINAESGRAGVIFTTDSVSGLAQIIAESDGLIADTLTIEILNRIRLDDFENYGSLSDLDYFWFVRSGTSAQMALVNAIGDEAGKSLRITYATGNGNAPYAGVARYNHDNLTAAEFLEFQLIGDASGRIFSILINEKDGRYWRYDHVMSTSESGYLKIDLRDFAPNDTATVMALDAIDEISFNILQGSGGAGQGVIYLDDIQFVIPSLETALEAPDREAKPLQFQLRQNFPNPFNQTTTIRYILPQADRVTLEIFDTPGRVVDRLLNGAPRQAGEHSLRWRNGRLASGIYFYRLQAGKYEAVRKCILIK